MGNKPANDWTSRDHAQMEGGPGAECPEVTRMLGTMAAAFRLKGPLISAAGEDGEVRTLTLRHGTTHDASLRIEGIRRGAAMMSTQSPDCLVELFAEWDDNSSSDEEETRTDRRGMYVRTVALGV